MNQYHSKKLINMFLRMLVLCLSKVMAIIKLYKEQVGLSSWDYKVNNITAEPYKVTAPWSISTVVSVHVTAARGSQSVSQ